MSSLNFNASENYQSNGHQILETDVVTLERNSTTSDSEPKSLVNNSDSSIEDWSSVTKELLDTLPQRWTRGLLYFIVFFVAIALPWSMLSQVDETGIARGKREPQKGYSFLLKLARRRCHCHVGHLRRDADHELPRGDLLCWPSR